MLGGFKVTNKIKQHKKKTSHQEDRRFKKN